MIKPRVRGQRGIYHVVSKGINTLRFFEEPGNREYFVGILKRAKKKFNFKLYGYALMSNHFHLLLDEDSMENISKIMQSIKISFTLYYNRKNGRTGTIYGERFFSKPVETDGHLASALAYIIQNPLKVNKSLDWTNHKELMEYRKHQLTDRRRVLEFIFGKKKRYKQKRVNKLLLDKCVKDGLEINKRVLISDEAAEKIVREKIAGVTTYEEFRRNIESYPDIILAIQAAKVSLLQLSRVLKISKNKIYKIYKKIKSKKNIK